MHKRTISAVIALATVLSFNVRVSAEPSLQDQLNTSQSQYNQSQNALSAAQKKVSDLETKIDSIDSQIGKSMDEIEKVKAQINQKQSDIEVTEKSIKKSEEDIKAEQELYNKRMRAMYINGSDGYVNILLDSNNLDDFMSKIDTVQRISEFDKNIITTLNAKKQQIEQQQAVLQSDKQKLVDLQNQNQTTLAELNNQKASEAPLIAQANSEEAAAVASSSSAKAQVEAINEKVAAAKAAVAAQEAQAAQAAQAQAAQAQAAAQASAKDTTTSTVVASANTGTSINRNTNRGDNTPSQSFSSGDALVTYAESFCGVPYVWGGESPSGFDCSGLVQYVYAHFGISLPRTSEDQYGCGSAVSISSLQPGDLVFFEGSSSPGHVAIYAGGGMMVEAPHTGANVRLTSLRSDVVGARRIR